MQLHGTVKRLISLGSLLSVLVEKKFGSSLSFEPLGKKIVSSPVLDQLGKKITSSLVFEPLGKKFASFRVFEPLGTSGSLEPSHTAKNVFQTYFRTDISKISSTQAKHIYHHLSESRVRFDGLAARIDDSISKKHYIHVEDGEADDYMHNLISVMRGVVPTQVYLQGGHYKKRLAVAHALWDYLVAKFGIEKPEIFTISAPMKDDFTSFDTAEGTALLSKDQIEKLLKEANQKDYQKAFTNAQESLRKTLLKNDFTTIALKTSPAGLTDVLREFDDKIAIIWTGPIRKRAKTDTYEKKFNYRKADQDADSLVTLNIPTVVVSPWLDNTRMASIIDQEYMHEFINFIKPVEGFEGFKGFKGLASMKLNKEAKFSYYFNLLADKFRDVVLKEYEEQARKLDAEEKEIKEDISLTVAQRKKKLTEIENRRVSNLDLGKRWLYFHQRNTEGKTFREFCPMDQTVELVADPSLRGSVQEVLEVDLKPSNTNTREVDVVPKLGGNTFIVSKFHSEGLENKIQDAIDWMAAGEPPRRARQ